VRVGLINNFINGHLTSLGQERYAEKISESFRRNISMKHFRTSAEMR
jgi:hypothetical protein